MAENLLRRYFWLIDTIRYYGPVSYDKINEIWRRSGLNEYGQELPKKTFRNHIEAIYLSLGIEIACNRRAGYSYYIKDEERNDRWTTNLLDTLTIQTAVGGGTGMKDRIVDYDLRYDPKVPFLAQLISRRALIRFRVFISFEEERKNPEMANYVDIDERYSHFCPLGLVQIMGNWYVVGIFCKEGKFFRKTTAFRIDDIAEIDIMEGEVMRDYPEDFSIRDYIDNLTWAKNEQFFSQKLLLYSDLYAMRIKDPPVQGPAAK